jgi:hypothetical protein
MWIFTLFLFVGLLVNDRENVAGITFSGILFLVLFTYWAYQRFVKKRKGYWF